MGVQITTCFIFLCQTIFLYDCNCILKHIKTTCEYTLTSMWLAGGGCWCSGELWKVDVASQCHAILLGRTRQP